ncbi:hypothetical protein Zmor_011940 [Zophobas morio]|jgi:hypothetical protein|uniref:Oxidoreductase-like domain-containing protein n=1 Tax=Zophobas morio TaxID=2755281 RepID=A0AA38LYT8_9CUCU|nr:hypothetical protein Zmor_011940 [Zophobas morio]
MWNYLAQCSNSMLNLTGSANILGLKALKLEATLLMRNYKIRKLSSSSNNVSSPSKNPNKCEEGRSNRNNSNNSEFLKEKLYDSFDGSPPFDLCCMNGCEDCVLFDYFAQQTMEEENSHNNKKVGGASPLEAFASFEKQLAKRKKKEFK